MTTADLTTLNDVKTWLGRSDSNSDVLLAALITRASRQILSYLQRPAIVPHSVTETREGSGGSMLVLKEWPVVSVASVLVDGIFIPEAEGTGSGWSCDGWNGVPPGRVQTLALRGYCFGFSAPGLCDFASVEIAYQAGYQVTGEAQTIADGIATVAAPYGMWASDVGVAYADGTPFGKVNASPARGQYALDPAAGTYDFNAGDNGENVSLSYGYVPSDLADACIELVAERYKYSQHIGEKTHSLGGNETVSFDNTRFTPLVTALLEPYRNIVPL